jgi:DNA-binding beta-propeller fold protein YncE
MTARHLEDDAAPALVKPVLLVLDVDQLDDLDVWSLDRQPAALAIRPDGGRAYLVLSSGVDGPWSRELVSLDLGGGATHRWPVPSGSFVVEMSPVGKLYLADTLGDHIWRLDTRTDTLLTPLHFPGAPLALGSRPA